MKRLLPYIVLAIVMFVAGIFVQSKAQQKDSLDFEDVSKSSGLYAPIMDIASRGIMHGDGKGHSY